MKAKFIDETLNPMSKVLMLIAYLFSTLIVALILLFIDLLAFHVLGLSVKMMIPLTKPTFGLITLFYAITCLPLIGIDMIATAVYKRKNPKGNPDACNFLYNFLDDCFRVLTFIGTLSQAGRAMTKAMPETDKLAYVLLFGIVFGFQQYIFKCWFKSVREMEDLNLVQSHKQSKVCRQRKKEIAVCIDKYENAKVAVGKKKDKAMLSTALIKVIEVLEVAKKDDVFRSNKNSLWLLGLLESKEYIALKNRALETKDSSGIKVDEVNKLFSLVRESLSVI